MKQQPYWKQQADRLLADGHCDLPLSAEDVARRVATNAAFSEALHLACTGSTTLLKMVRIQAAGELCRAFEEQDNGL